MQAATAAVLAPVLVAAVLTNASAQPPVQSVVHSTQALYNRIKDLKGKFEQIYTDTLYRRTRTSYGYLYVKKPGMMRWNYVTPEQKAFISDGQVLWVWEPADKQAFRNPLDIGTLSTGLTFLLGSGDLTEEFRAEYATGQTYLAANADELVLKLVPRKPTAQYQYLLLAIRPSDYAVTQSVVISKSSTNHFIFAKLVFNSGLRKQRFRFRPPPDTRVIDTSESKPGQ